MTSSYIPFSLSVREQYDLQNILLDCLLHLSENRDKISNSNSDVTLTNEKKVFDVTDVWIVRTLLQ